MKNTILWIFMKDVLANSLKGKCNFEYEFIRKRDN